MKYSTKHTFKNESDNLQGSVTVLLSDHQASFTS